jgi:predicted HicB family RNase H-like nuclease
MKQFFRSVSKARDPTMNSMNYRGYLARVDFDAEDRLFVGHVAGINDIVGFHADTVDGLESAFQEAVDDYIETCETTSKAPEKPYSGKVMFRVPPEVHARAALAAQLAGKSLNQWAEDALKDAADRSLGRLLRAE